MFSEVLILLGLQVRFADLLIVGELVVESLKLGVRAPAYEDLRDCAASREGRARTAAGIKAGREECFSVTR